MKFGDWTEGGCLRGIEQEGPKIIRKKNNEIFNLCQQKKKRKKKNEKKEIAAFWQVTCLDCLGLCSLLAWHFDFDFFSFFFLAAHIYKIITFC